MSGIHDSFSGSLPEHKTLYIRMTRGERRIADELREKFGGFERVTIDVDGERHEFSADSLIRLLEKYEDALEPHSNQLEPSRWHELFGTPERAARTLANLNCDGSGCDGCSLGDIECNYGEDALLEWLRGNAE